MYTIAARNGQTGQIMIVTGFNSTFDLDRWRRVNRLPKHGTQYEVSSRTERLFSGRSDSLLRACLTSISVAESVLTTIM